MLFGDDVTITHTSSAADAAGVCLTTGHFQKSGHPKAFVLKAGNMILMFLDLLNSNLAVAKPNFY